VWDVWGKGVAESMRRGCQQGSHGCYCVRGRQGPEVAHLSRAAFVYRPPVSLSCLLLSTVCLLSAVSLRLWGGGYDMLCKCVRVCYDLALCLSCLYAFRSFLTMWHSVKVFNARFVCVMRCTVLCKILRKILDLTVLQGSSDLTVLCLTDHPGLLATV
jgi:hypothetical protein